MCGVACWKTGTTGFYWLLNNAIISKEDDVSELDVQQATINLTSTRSAISTLKLGRRQTLNRLAILLGMTPYDLEQSFTKRGRSRTRLTKLLLGFRRNY